jgi:hypothetical protein
MWEMNGGDPPWAVGYEASGDVPEWMTVFKKAYQRIYVVFKGTQMQVKALTPAFTANGGIGADAQNLFFSWNPQESESSANSAYNRDTAWPGAAYTDAAATELYLSPGNTATSAMTNTNRGGAHKAFYAEYAGAQNKLLATGEGGDRWQNSKDDAAATARAQSFTTMFQNYPAHKVFCWWNAGSPAPGMGVSEIGYRGKGANVTAAEKAFCNSEVMNPTLTVTYRPQVSGFTVLNQNRVPVGKAGTRYGPAQLSGGLFYRVANGTLMSPANVQGYGYGRYITTTIRLSRR